MGAPREGEFTTLKHTFQVLVALLQSAVSREKKGYKTVHNLHMNSRIGHECKCEKCEMTGSGDGMHSAALTATTTAI